MTKGYCFGCKRENIEIERRTVKLPVGEMAKSQEPMCDECYAKVKEALKPKE